MRIALTRQVSPSLQQCELTHLERQPIDLELALSQHAQYEACLASLGCQVQRLEAGPGMPDSVFIEDMAVVLPEAAVIARPGAPSRLPELPAVAAALEPYRELLRIEAPGSLDGGDVLQIGKELFVGLSGRSNPAGLEQLQEMLQVYGYRVHGVQVSGCLHLKSAATLVARDTLLINQRWVDGGFFGALNIIEIHPGEPFGANALLIDETVIYPAAYPRTRARLETAGVQVLGVDASELAKAEGGVTCCSLIFEDQGVFGSQLQRT